MTASYTTNSINVNYTMNKYDIDFSINFGKGIDCAIEKNENVRKNYSTEFPVEVFESGYGETYNKGYRVIGNCGAVVIKLSNIKINEYPTNNNYEYALGFAVDNKNPEYSSESITLPNNIERDGKMWTIPANDRQSYKFDQNPHGKYQWVIQNAEDIGYEPTAEEYELGFEKSSQTTGLIYITFMIFMKKKENTKGITYDDCGGTTRGSTRGTTRGSSAARFGYGNEAESSSKKSEFEWATGTEKYVLPIRFRIKNESEKNNVNCSETLKGASLNSLRTQTIAVPF